MFGVIEAGGTKFICAVCNDKFEIIERVSIPTTTPTETFGRVFDFLDKFHLKSLGVGSFGPIDLNKQSNTYGFITSTPKKGWNNFNFIGKLEERYPLIPIAWTTDVNAAAYGEYKKGSAMEDSSCIYLTVGTGIGGGAIINDEIIEGFGHPEMGHLLVRMHPEDTYKGHCSFHGNCLEGLASGPAIKARYGIDGKDLSVESKAWEMIAYYLAQAILSYTLILRPEKIILGGGVMKQEQLFPLIRNKVKSLIEGYIQTPELEEFIVYPGLGDNAGIVGCLLLAKKKLEADNEQRSL